ncbi:MAG: hypothetical protein IJC05_05030 [Phascolarctobacterium sp.]|nr:hypothetical protein [Phascolarctobacterium sp.]
MNNIIYILAAIVLFMGGYNAHDYLHTCPEAKPVILTEYKDRVQTELKYAEKEADEKADIDIAVGKPVLNVKVNDKEFIVRKADDEQYVFEKNKLSLTQTSSTDLNITIPTVDKTRRYEIGIGVSKDGAVGLVGFPINSSNHLGGWVAGNEDNVMGGVSLKF